MFSRQGVTRLIVTKYKLELCELSESEETLLALLEHGWAVGVHVTGKGMAEEMVK